MSIRSRLLLLVLAVWLPAAAGFGLLARATYEKETAAARENVQQLAQGINLLAEQELDKRVLVAQTLASSNAVRDGDFARFHEEATAATQGSVNWALLVDANAHIANTLVPYEEARHVPRAKNGPLAERDAQVILVPRGPIAKRAAITVFAPVPGAVPQKYNVGVSFPPDVMLGVLRQSVLPTGGVTSIINESQQVMARSRDPERWIGESASGELKRRAMAGETGFASSVTLDGVQSLTYLSPRNRYGWAVVIGLPQATLDAAARRTTTQALTAAVCLLFLGLAIALFGARGISGTVQALGKAATEVGGNRIPPKLVSGIPEVDGVSAALHEAGLRAQEATRLLERRVEEAVQQAREAQAKLLDGQKHEAIGRLTGGIAHDFNNLLQTISTAHYMLNRNVPEGPQRRVLQGAMRATTKAADLVKQLLTFGRAQALQPQVVSLSDLVLKSQELTGKAVGERIALAASIEPGLPMVFVDPVQLELALLNLVFNARDAMPQGGHITILGRQATASETAHLKHERYVCLEVQDDGAGMSAQTQARAFEPYFTTKPMGAGSGLGLAQVQAFARQSGGDVLLVSDAGRGTRVSLLLPASQATAAPEEQQRAADAPRRSMAVLMVEDDVLVSSVVVPALETEGHRVLLCHRADDAVGMLGGGLQVDVLFTDVMMPGTMNGMDLAQWCRANRPELPVLVATGYAEQQPDAELAAAVLRKPYEIGALLDALQRAVDKQVA